MKYHPRLCPLFLTLALLLSHTMCAVIAVEYTRLSLCVTCSAPPSTAFLFAIPFLLGILLCLGLAYAFRLQSPQ